MNLFWQTGLPHSLNHLSLRAWSAPACTVPSLSLFHFPTFFTLPKQSILLLTEEPRHSCCKGLDKVKYGGILQWVYLAGGKLLKITSWKIVLMWRPTVHEKQHASWGWDPEHQISFRGNKITQTLMALYTRINFKHLFSLCLFLKPGQNPELYSRLMFCIHSILAKFRIVLGLCGRFW